MGLVVPSTILPKPNGGRHECLELDSFPSLSLFSSFSLFLFCTPSRSAFTCTLPSTVPSGYVNGGNGCTGQVSVAACTGLSCASGYTGTPAVKCSTSGGTFDLSGCSGVSISMYLCAPGSRATSEDRRRPPRQQRHNQRRKPGYEHHHPIATAPDRRRG